MEVVSAAAAMGQGVGPFPDKQDRRELPWIILGGHTVADLLKTGVPNGKAPMKRVAVYIEPSTAGALGGAQAHAAVLVAALSLHAEVDVLVRDAGFDLGDLGAASGTDLSRARRRVVTAVDDAGVARIGERYDLFVAFVHELPPLCPAPLGLLVVLFPLSDKARMWPWSDAATPDTPQWRRAARLAFHDWRWRRRFAGYQIRTANSAFTARWTTRRWGIDCDVVYPPVEMAVDSLPKCNSILSVGRFSAVGLSKNQLEMLHAYAELRADQHWPRDWRYQSAGALFANSANNAYFSRCATAAALGAAELCPNLSPVELRRLYAQADIFWHAAGASHDEATHPEKSEHFGMVTVEAMSNGCVPVVLRRGGQPEIVRDGETGYLCNSLEEVKTRTRALVADVPRLRRLQEAARHDAGLFSREQFVSRMFELLGRRGWTGLP